MTTKIKPGLRLGFSGTQEGMSRKQKIAFRKFLLQYKPTEFHHGDCIGADADADYIVKNALKGICEVHIHPCPIQAKRAWCRADVMYRVLPPLERNHVIVDMTDHLFFTPQTDEEVLRSGTWATYRYAKKQKKPFTQAPR